MTDRDDIEALREAMDDQREDIRAALAEDLGGDPEDYDSTRHTDPDGE